MKYLATFENLFGTFLEKRQKPADFDRRRREKREEKQNKTKDARPHHRAPRNPKTHPDAPGRTRTLHKHQVKPEKHPFCCP